MSDYLGIGGNIMVGIFRSTLTEDRPWTWYASVGIDVAIVIALIAVVVVLIKRRND